MDKFVCETLRAVLQKRGLDTSGRKDTLVTRLHDFIKEGKVTEADIINDLQTADVNTP
jgi:SAP domain